MSESISGSDFGVHSAAIIDFENRQRLKRYDPNRVVATGRYGVDENGEIVYDYMKKPSYENGSGFVISYTEKMNDFILKTKNCSVVRLFIYLCHNQTFARDGQFGFRCTRKHLAQVLNLDAKSVYTSLAYLAEQFLVVEIRVNGTSEFMVNPDYVTIGRSKHERMIEWSKRWEIYWHQKHGR